MEILEYGYKDVNNMKINKQKKLFWFLTCISFLLLFIGVITGYSLFIWLSVGEVIIELVLWIIFFRCPKCGSHLGRIDENYTYCPHCGVKLDK